MQKLWIVPLLAVSAGLFGCSETAQNPGARGPNQVQVLPETRITKTDPNDLPTLFQAANDRLLKDDFAGAASEFDRIVAVDPKAPTALPSLFNAGVAYLGVGDREKALVRFQAAIDRYPDSSTTRGALLRISRIYSYEERWPELEKTAELLLARTDLSVLDRVEALGADGLSLVSQGKADEGNAPILKARDLIEDNKLGQSGTPPIELAQVSFTLGEIRRMKSEQIVFDPFPPDFGSALEARCTGLLDAQEAYTDAMRSKDAHWSAMSGFRVGQLYQTLHHDVMKVSAPAALKTLRQKQLWEGAMRLRYRILLEKGLSMMDGTVRLGDRTGESSEWIARAKESQKALQLALADEKEALSKMPFTEDEMRDALDKLKKKPGAAGAPMTAPAASTKPASSPAQVATPGAPAPAKPKAQADKNRDW